MMWTSKVQLRVMEGLAQGQTYPMDSQRMNIGRAVPGTPRVPGWVLVEDETVSRQQAELHWNEETGLYRLLHRSATNPTLVNEVEVTETDLHLGDRIRVGRSLVQLEPRYPIPRRPLPSGKGDPAETLPTASPRVKPARRIVLPLKKSVSPAPEPSTPEHAPAQVSQPEVPAPKVKPPYFLEVVEGPHVGKRYSLTGPQVVFGGPSALGTRATKKSSEQEVIVPDSSVPTRCVALSWDESLQNWEIARTTGGHLPVALARTMDGLTWTTTLPFDQSSVVRNGDIFTIGKSSIRLEAGD